MQKTILENVQIDDKTQLINNLFSIFNFFQNYYLGNELKEFMNILNSN